MGKPVAELWMGAHPKAPSRIVLGGGEQALDLYLDSHPEALGPAAQVYDGLPFLMKVLAAAKPLSIQAHPNAAQAREGFDRENALEIPLDAPSRNYKDPRHKPELICALTPFTALCGFRPYPQIIAGLRHCGLDQVLPEAQDFIQSASRTAWQSCFQAILAMDASAAVRVVENARGTQEQRLGPGMQDALRWVGKLAELYPGDAGALAPLYLNLVELQPQEALYLDAGIPHAYLNGVGIEVMANSDNVLRGGLTPKYINREELIRVLDFEPLDLMVQKAVPDKTGVGWFHTPAREFSLGIADIMAGQALKTSISGPAILLCQSGNILISTSGEGYNALKGDAFFIDARATKITLTGEGKAFICVTAPGN